MNATQRKYLNVRISLIRRNNFWQTPIIKKPREVIAAEKVVAKFENKKNKDIKSHRNRVNKDLQKAGDAVNFLAPIDALNAVKQLEAKYSK